MTEQEVKNEMRLFALESVICQHLATFYQSMPADVFAAVQKQALEGTRRQTFAGADAATSDLFSAELETAVERLYKMIGSHLEKSRMRGDK